MKEIIRISGSDGTNKTIELTTEQWRTIRYAEDGKPAIMAKLSKKISAAPLRERLRRLEAEIAEPLNDAGE